MKNYILHTLILLTFIVSGANAQKTQPETERYIKVTSGYLMVLRQGDNMLEEIEKMAVAEKLPSATFTGMGFVNITFGFFDFETKEYNPKDFKNMELASLTGSIAWQNGKPSVHTHGVVTGSDFTAHGGHILKATVSTGSVEIMVTVHDKKLERIKEEKLGANVLCVGDCKP